MTPAQTLLIAALENIDTSKGSDDNGYDAQSAVESSVKAMEFMRNGDSAKDWNEGNFEEAAKIWPEAPLEANYFADTLMFVVTEE